MIQFQHVEVIELPENPIFFQRTSGASATKFTTMDVDTYEAQRLERQIQRQRHQQQLLVIKQWTRAIRQRM